MAIPGKAAVYNLEVRRGDSWTRVFTCRGPDDAAPWLDLSGYGARLVVAEDYDAPPVLAIDHTDPQLALDAGAATVTVDLAGSATAAWAIEAGLWQLDLLPANDPDERFPFLAGSVLVGPSL